MKPRSPLAILLTGAAIGTLAYDAAYELANSVATVMQVDTEPPIPAIRRLIEWRRENATTYGWVPITDAAAYALADRMVGVVMAERRAGRATTTTKEGATR